MTYEARKEFENAIYVKSGTKWKWLSRIRCFTFRQNQVKRKPAHWGSRVAISLMRNTNHSERTIIPHKELQIME
jgi:hypothetical protein